MKKIHVVSATIGLICAAAFAVVPFASADAGPNAHIAANNGHTTSVNANGAGMVKKHMNTNNVKSKDDGCGS